MPVLTVVHRVCKRCAGLEGMLLLLARMAQARENGTCPAGRPADPFAVRNRMSLPGSLHRISAMKGDQGASHTALAGTFQVSISTFHGTCSVACCPRM